MYSPGTVKAIGLIAKGVGTDRAFEVAREVDNQVAQTRLDFYSAGSLDKFAFSTLPSNIGTATTAPISDNFAVTPLTSSKVKLESIEDMLVNNNYNKAVNPTSFTNTTGGPFIIPENFLSTEAPKKKRSYYDSLFPDLVQGKTMDQLAFETNIAESLIDPKKKVKTPEQLNQIAADTITKALTTPVSASTPRLDLSTLKPEDKQQEKIEKQIKHTNINQLAKSFLAATDEQEILTKRKLLEKEIEVQIKDLDSRPMPNLKGLGQGGAMNVAFEFKSGIDAKKAELLKIKEGINDTYTKKIIGVEANKSLQAVKQQALASENLDDYLKSLDKYKNVAGGLANLTTDAVSLVKKANQDKYLDRTLTEQDLAIGGEKVLNEQALQRFAQKTNLSVGEAIAEDRYDNTRNHLVQAHALIGSQAIVQLNKESVELIKKQEQLIKLSQSPDLTEAKAKELEKEFSKISKQVDLNNKLAEKFDEIHSYKAIRGNKEINNFAGSYLQEQESLYSQSKRRFSDKTSNATKFGMDFQRALGGLLSETVKLGTGILRFGFDQLGMDAATTAMRRFDNYITPQELVDFDRVNNKGQYKTQSSIVFTDKEGNTEFRPSALFITGAQTAPLVLATMAGGNALAAAGGRALQATQSTLLAKNLISAQRVSQFTNALATTKNYGAAYRAALSQSANGIVRALGTSIPYNAAMASVVYPQEFNRTYEDLYRKGISNARGKAHAIAAVSTGIEVLTETIFPEYKLLDDFAERGIGLGKALDKYGPKWTGNLQQYRTLYGDIFGNTFSNKTLDYLAVKAANAGGKVYAGARFMASRGIEEGIEETAAEIFNAVADNQFGLAAMRGEPPSELTLEDLTNAFLGGLVGPPIGMKTQIKNYSENKKYGELFDIMLNGHYYKNKINTELKNGNVTPENAAVMLSKIQELENVEKTYGVTNLRNFQSIKSISTLQDLMDDPNLQFDYFKSVLQKNKIDEELVKLETRKYTPEEKENLLAQAEEATAKIDDYKKRSDFYSRMTDADKKKIVDDNINKKVSITRFANNEKIDSLNKDLEEVTAKAVLDKRPEHFLDSLRTYRDKVASIQQERTQAEIDAKESGLYNPITDALENEQPTSSLQNINNTAELENLMVQTLLAPNKGHELGIFLDQGYKRQIEALERDSDNYVENFLANINRNNKTSSTNTVGPDGQLEVRPGEADSAQTEVTLETLTQEQQDELNKTLAEFSNAIADLENRQNEIADIVNAVLNQALPKEIADITDSEAQGKAIDEWISALYNNIYDKTTAIREIMEQDPGLKQEVLFNSLRFDEYISDNKEKIDKKIAEIQEKFKKNESTPTETRTEVSLVPGVDVPELIPSDVTPEFEESLELLEELPKSISVTDTSNVSGDVLVEERHNPERTRVLQELLGMVAESTSLDSAKAKMAAVMQAAGSSVQEIKDTLDLMDKVAKSEPVLEQDYTHMFNLLLIKAGDLSNLRFPITSTGTTKTGQVETLRTQEQVELLAAIPELETYRVNGKIDKNLMSPEVRKKYDEIYEKYNEAITPLLEDSAAAPLSEIEAEKADAQTVKNRMQEIEKQPISINVTTDASGKMEQTSEEVVSQIKAELDKIGLPYTDVVANDKGSTYFVVTKDAQQHEILRLLKTGGGLVKPVLIKTKWINHLIKTQPEDLYNFVNAELAASEQPAPSSTNQAEIVLAPTEVQNTAEQNIEETKQNTKKVVTETPVVQPTPSQVDEIENTNQTHTTNPLKIIVGENKPDTPFLEVQVKIIETLDKEKNRANTGLVDFFTLIEDVLGPQVLTEMENIFNEIQQGVTEERKAELRNKFIALIPATFMKSSVKAFIFDSQIVGKISQSNVNVVDQRNLNATQSELFQINRGRKIPTVTTVKGVVHKNVLVRMSGDKLFLLDVEEVTDADGNIKENKIWIPFDQIKNPETVFAYPMVGAESIMFNDLNVLVFTAFDSEGKVQKFNNDGAKSEQGNKALLLYLPTAKNVANPTPQQKAFNDLRLGLVEGNRLKMRAPLVRPVIKEGGETDATTGFTKPVSYSFEFNTGEVVSSQTVMTPAELIEEQIVVEEIAQDNITQKSSIAALERIIQASKNIPDPSKEGYLIEGKRFERQSGFVARVMGTKKVDTEESVLNMELGAAVGNLLDIIGRDVLGGAKVKTLDEYIKEAEQAGRSLRDGQGYKLDISQEIFDQVVTELQLVAQELTDKGWKIFTEGLVVYRKFTEAEKSKTGFEGVAGAMDIVAIDPDGGVHIIDFKNKKFRNEDHFKSTMYKGNANYPSNMSKWSTQQTTYGILSKDFGLPIRSINILAFASQYSLINDKITIDKLTLGSKEVPVLDKHKSPISSSIIKLKYDSAIAKQIEGRTSVPKVSVKKTTAQETIIKEKDGKDNAEQAVLGQPTSTTTDKENLDKIKEHLPEFTDGEVQNANLVLSSLNIDLENIQNDMLPEDSNPDNLNIPPCN